MSSKPRTAPRLRVALASLVASLVALALPAAASALPADRAYEMVSPPEKNFGDIGAGLTNSNTRASLDGDGIAYSVAAGFGDAQANTLTSGYLATRGTDFWGSTGLTLPLAPMASLTYFGPIEVAPDMSKAVVSTNMDQATGEELPAGQPYAWYLYDPVTKQAERMTPPSPDGSDYVLNKSKGAEEMSGSEDFSHVYFNQVATLTPDAVGIAGHRLYRYADGTLSLASLLPDGTPISGSLGSAITGNKTVPTPYAVSADGSVVFFNRGPAAAREELYRSDYGAGATPDTVLVNASENTLESVPVGPALFAGASADGSIAYFLSDQRLVDADTDSVSDVYRWDAAAAAGSRLTLISAGGAPADPAKFGLGLSEDGEIMYFAHSGQLVPEAPVNGDYKLYAWDHGTLRFIASRPQFGPQDVVSSPDGRYFAFMSRAPGTTPEDNGGLNQVYRYDLATGGLACASCVPLPGASTEAAQFLQVGLSLAQLSDEPRRNVNNSGDVFFDTEEALLPEEDTNHRRDVYVWNDDGVELISSGRSPYDSIFADASVSGDSVFFRTYERLSAWDTNDHSDIYNARVDGGQPEPPPPGVPCEGSVCQGPPSLPPPPSEPGSGTFEGDGNPIFEDNPEPAMACAELARDADRAKRKARRLKRRARVLRAKGHVRRAKRTARRARQAQRDQRRIQLRASSCNVEASR